jgi:hypothetical protein
MIKSISKLKAIATTKTFEFANHHHPRNASNPGVAPKTQPATFSDLLFLTLTTARQLAQWWRPPKGVFNQTFQKGIESTPHEGHFILALLCWVSLTLRFSGGAQRRPLHAVVGRR